MFDLITYELPNGERPVDLFIEQLEPGMQVKALASIEILKQFGNKLREPYSKSLGDGLFELRIKFAGDITRIFYFFFIGRKIVLTNGFVKKTQKTPSNEMELARKYKADYERRSEQNE